MSLPTFPDKENTPTREQALNQIITSIAMEEVGLSHVINAEGEKIQYVLGTLPDVPPLATPPTIAELLAINQSVRDTLDTTVQNQMFLRGKLQSTLNAATLTGPTGATGPAGPAIDPDTTIFSVNDGTAPQELKYQGTLQFASDTLDITVEDGPTVKIENSNRYGAMLIFASSTAVTVKTPDSGLYGIGCMLGYGNEIAFDFTNPVIDAEQVNHDFAFIVPQDGVLTSIGCYFTALSGGDVNYTTNVSTAIYRSTTPNNFFTKIAQTEIYVPFEPVTASPLHGHTSKLLNVQLNQNDRLFVAVWAETGNVYSTSMSIVPNVSLGIALG